jgi:formate-dependent nitrite reductase membrane component NrfD
MAQQMMTRQWMVTHDWMTKPQPQREWIERRGILIWISEVFSALGSGLFIVSLFMNSWWGMLAGWLIIMFLKLPIHLAYLGKPMRFWRLIPPFSNAWKTSWFARGVAFSVLFGTFAFIQIVIGQPDINSWLLSTSYGPAVFPVYVILGIISGLFALGIGIYGGLMMNFCKGMPAWNQGLLPIVFIFAGVADGLALIMGIGLAGGDASIAAAEFVSRYLLLINIFLIVCYLISVNYTSAVSKISISELTSGRTAIPFWGGLILVGLIIPAAISIVSMFGAEASSMLLIIAVICHTVGAFALKYCLLKVGIYRPLLPRFAAY